MKCFKNAHIPQQSMLISPSLTWLYMPWRRHRYVLCNCRYANTTWSPREAPRLAVLAWDMSNMDAQNGVTEDMLMLKSCSALRRDYVRSDILLTLIWFGVRCMIILLIMFYNWLTNILSTSKYAWVFVISNCIYMCS